jgi:transcription antitermination protein NusB
MPSRRRSRQRAVEVLYMWDMRRQPVEEAIEAFYGILHSDESDAAPQRDAFMDTLVAGTVDRVEEIDKQISGHAEHWRIERMPAVDRNILRLAIYEMLYGGTPPPVAIDEALELARRYAGEDSIQFINGVLDAVRRERAGDPFTGNSEK